MYDDDDLYTSCKDVDAEWPGPTSLCTAMHEIVPMAFKVDIWRYGILWLQGGIYADADLEVWIEPSSIFDMSRPDLLQSFEDHGTPNLDANGDACVYQALIATGPKSPAIAAVLRRSLANIAAGTFGETDSPGASWLGITGPCTVSMALSAEGLGGGYAPRGRWDGHDLRCNISAGSEKVCARNVKSLKKGNWRDGYGELTRRHKIYNSTDQHSTSSGHSKSLHRITV